MASWIEGKALPDHSSAAESEPASKRTGPRLSKHTKDSPLGFLVAQALPISRHERLTLIRSKEICHEGKARNAGAGSQHSASHKQRVAGQQGGGGQASQQRIKQSSKPGPKQGKHSDEKE
jgi:hypothetical protein